MPISSPRQLSGRSADVQAAPSPGFSLGPTGEQHQQMLRTFLRELTRVSILEGEHGSIEAARAGRVIEAAHAVSNDGSANRTRSGIDSKETTVSIWVIPKLKQRARRARDL